MAKATTDSACETVAPGNWCQRRISAARYTRWRATVARSSGPASRPAPRLGLKKRTPYAVVARYQGGHNAGHTVRFGDQHFSLRLIPSGILHEQLLCVLGNGMVIDPEAFFSEIGNLEKTGVRIQGRLFVSERAHVIFPDHQ